MIVHQIRSTDGTGTLSYLLVDEAAGVAAMIDPNIEDDDAIGRLVKETGTRLSHVIDTHTHVDHVSGAHELKRRYGALIHMHENTKNKRKIVDQGDKFGIGETLRANAGVPIDRYLNDDDIIEVGTSRMKVMFTPGHTDNHVALVADDCLFTGDLLLIGQAGRSDLPGGDPGQQYDSLTKKILPLPDKTRMYPGHDYSDNEFAWLGEEKKTNPFLRQRSKSEYLEFVKEFFPPLAEAIAAGGKMTLQCGVARVPRPTDSFKNLTARELYDMLQHSGTHLLLDVREPQELVMMGAIEGVKNISIRALKGRLGELPSDKSVPVVCICASGSRSVEAAHLLRQNGYQNVMNLAGGTISWIQSGYSVVRPELQKWIR